MKLSSAILVVVLALVDVSNSAADEKKHHHHGHHHHHKNGQVHKTAEVNATVVRSAAPAAKAAAPVSVVSAPATLPNEAAIVEKMRSLETALATREKVTEGESQRGTIKVNGPLPADFSERFVKASAQAAGCSPDELQVLEVESLGANDDMAEVIFQAPKDIVAAVEQQAADPSSKLANSPLRSFLVARDVEASPSKGAAFAQESAGAAPSNSGIDIDTAMPYGELEPFGREDTAQELTESSVKESDEMVDQLERAEVAEEKRAVFRALTRLRGAAITSFDGVARSQTGNIDEYNKVHRWRSTHPLHHLADEESDISKWAFPDNADF